MVSKIDRQGPGRVSRLYVIKGRVQGVGYRYFAQTAAAEFHITGWVRNRDDGAVETYATGTPEQLAAYSGRLRMGPRFGEVRSVEEIEAPLLQSDGFSIKH
ncbi:acylphosphatase [uncultured Paludibaculum sp.]|uniref:acylphosphatase n=1 Tax=uncultured Paludibaculum sp. TaxID=1765020 RepID=UPI002AAB2B97|nr:acylphosphatase [uncultured Paludibaculum sp.]